MKRYLIVSDLEVGAADVFDDFDADDQFVTFIKDVRDQFEGKTCLIINGDGFDHLKASYQGEHKTPLTEDSSLDKTRRFFLGHPKVFDALTFFLENERNSIRFHIGNHDFDLLFPMVQRLLRERLGEKKRIIFAHFLSEGELHVEHGNNFDPIHCLPKLNYVLKKDGVRQLRLPLAEAFITQVAGMKKDHPLSDRIYPNDLVLSFKPQIKRKLSIEGKKYFKYLMNPFGPKDPSVHWNLSSLQEMVWRALRSSPKSSIVGKEKAIVKRFSKARYIILGHTHVVKQEVCNGCTLIQTGTWRDEYTVDGDRLIPKDKPYVEIFMYKGKVLSADLHVIRSAKKIQKLKKFLN